MAVPVIPYLIRRNLWRHRWCPRSAPGFCSPGPPIHRDRCAPGQRAFFLALAGLDVGTSFEESDRAAKYDRPWRSRP
jgi:hypothetical protein